MRRHKRSQRWRLLVGVVGLCCAAMVSVGLSMADSPSPGTAHYIDNRPGSGCSDTGPGTSPEAPWCTFGPAERSYAPGDQILLARGAEWNQQLTLTGSGAAVGAYGTGDRPKIIRSGQESDRAIVLTNPSGWLISDLEIGNAGTGILTTFSTAGNRDLTFRDLYLHDIKGIHQGSGSGTRDGIWNSAGIELTSTTFNSSHPAEGPIVGGVTFENIEGTGNLDTISIDWFNSGYSATAPGQKAAENVLMRDLNLHDNTGTGTGCDDAMRITAVSHWTMIDSRIDRSAACHSDTGTAAVYMAYVNDSNIFNNTFTNLPDTASPDMVAFDFECCTDHVTISANYFASNAGAAISFLAIHPGLGQETDTLAAGNTFVQNGHGAFRRAGTTDTPTGIIRDNLYYEPNGFQFNDGADFSGFTLTNNKPIASPDSVSHMTSGGVWTAPAAGTVSIRSRVLMASPGGAGAVARITENGVRVWPQDADQSIAPGDQVGHEAFLDNITVAAGDDIAFETEGAPVSWAPTIAYTEGAATPPGGLYRCFNPATGDHLTSTDPNCEGYPKNGGRLARLVPSQADGTVPLYRCYNPTTTDHLTTTDPNCEGYPNKEGQQGFIHTTQVASSIPLYRCNNPATGHHLTTRDPTCEGYPNKEGVLGYALP